MKFFLFQEFLEELRRMLIIYNDLLAKESNITDQSELKSLIKSISSRWIEINRKSDDLTSKYECQYRAWILYDSELNVFRNQVLSEFEQRINRTISNDINQLLDLNEIHTFLNEIRVNQKKKSLKRNLFFFLLLVT